jgi:hypothetical protein
MRVHLRATFCSSQQTVARAGNSQRRVRRLTCRIANTAWPTRMYGNVGQANCGAAKASMVNFTMIANDELGGTTLR